MGSSDTGADNSYKQVYIHVYSIEVRYLSLMSIVNFNGLLFLAQWMTLCMPEFTGRSKLVLLLQITFVIYFSC